MGVLVYNIYNMLHKTPILCSKNTPMLRGITSGCYILRHPHVDKH